MSSNGVLVQVWSQAVKQDPYVVTNGRSFTDRCTLVRLRGVLTEMLYGISADVKNKCSKSTLDTWGDAIGQVNLWYMDKVQEVKDGDYDRLLLNGDDMKVKAGNGVPRLSEDMEKARLGYVAKRITHSCRTTHPHEWEKAKSKSTDPVPEEGQEPGTPSAATAIAEPPASAGIYIYIPVYTYTYNIVQLFNTLGTGQYIACRAWYIGRKLIIGGCPTTIPKVPT